MIKSVMVFNGSGQPRVLVWYQQLDVPTQQRYLREIIIYRHYATLYFVFVADASESPLAILDLIQVFVEALDRAFTHVCELDLIFKPDEVQAVLAEVVSGGLVAETQLGEIGHALD
ncbi:hypothetical protein CXG81DRAFT_7297, partial [Caulochytrium protostelioides]